MRWTKTKRAYPIPGTASQMCHAVSIHLQRSTTVTRCPIVVVFDPSIKRTKFNERHTQLILRLPAKPYRATSHSPARRKCARSSCGSRWKSNNCCLQFGSKLVIVVFKKCVVTKQQAKITKTKQLAPHENVPQGFACAQSRTTAGSTPICRQCSATEDKTRAGICDVTLPRTSWF